MFAHTTTLVLRLFFLALITPTSATFLQWAICDDSRGSGLIPYSLHAELARGSVPSSQLWVGLVRFQDGKQCKDTPGTSLSNEHDWPQATVQLEWTDFWGSHSFNKTTKMQLNCTNFEDARRPMPLGVNSSRVEMTLLDTDGLDIHSLSTIAVQARIESTIFEETSCIASLITPASTPRVSSALLVTPLAAFIFVFLVSVARTIAYAAATESDPDHPSGINNSIAHPRDGFPTVVLPLVYDCLHFLQFVFLTGGLSLSFPGFYPAAVGHLHGFALFANFALPIRSLRPQLLPKPIMVLSYPGTVDGIYEVNGTYGGYPGFEVMAQMIGSPMTGDTWALMVLLAAGIAVLLGLFLCALELVKPNNVLGLPMLSADLGTSRRARAARIANRVLRLVLSYFAMPVVALSCYQFALYDTFGENHLTFAVIFGVMMLLASAWLVARGSRESLRALVLDNGHHYQKLGGQETSDEKPANHDDTFVIVLFVSNLAQGLIFGGLQKWGLVQLVLLMVCEGFMLLAVRILKPYALSSPGFLAVPLRLALLACFIPSVFRPSTMLHVKTICSYAALCIAAVGLLGLFVVPSCWHLSRLVVRGSKLNNSSSVRQDDSAIRLRPLLLPEALESRQNLKSSLDTTSPPRTTSTNDSFGQYYRQPRSSGSTKPGQRTCLSWDHSMVSREVSPLRSVASSSDSMHSGNSGLSSGSRIADSSTKQPGHGQTASMVHFSSSEVEETSRPLGPKWNDYSFREADLFFAARRPPSELHAGPRGISDASLSEQPRWWSQSIASMRSLVGWNRSGSGEKGFTVVRPNTVPLPPQL